MDIEGQLNQAERRLLMDVVRQQPTPAPNILEIGTWLGGGSTLHFLRALDERRNGHLWGVEADASIYERMLANIKAAYPDAVTRFTPLFGKSQQVIPKWLSEQDERFEINIAFLDGGNNPMEQITEFRLIEPRMPVNAILLSHDAKLRKGKWLVPYVSNLDNWESKLHDVSVEGLFYAKKIASQPTSESLRRARNRLLRMRLEPAEIAAALLPAKLCRFALNLLPRRLASNLAEGKN